MQGFMNGSDKTDGIVTVIDANNTHPGTYTGYRPRKPWVKLPAVRGDARMSWLYGEFAKLVCKETIGETRQQPTADLEP